MIGTPAFGMLINPNPLEEAKKVCPASGRTSNLIPLDYCKNTNKLYFLGPGMPLMFDYSCFLMFSLMLAYCIYGIYVTINFSKGGYCQLKELSTPGYCGARWKTQISTGNTLFLSQNGHEKMVATILFFVLYVVRIIFFRFARKKDVEIDGDVTTPKDYTLWLSDLPTDIKPKELA